MWGGASVCDNLTSKNMKAFKSATDHSPLMTGETVSDASAISATSLRSRFERETGPLLRSLYSVARQLTSTDADAEDLLQDTMLKAYSAYRSYETDTHLRAWLIRIMRNTWIDQYRRRQRRPTECLTDNVDDWEYSASVRLSSVEHDTADTWAIRQAFSVLPENLRRALYFAYVEGLTYEQVAHLEQIPRGAVTSRLHRAKYRLRASLTNLQEGMPLLRNEELSDLAS